MRPVGGTRGLSHERADPGLDSAALQACNDFVHNFRRQNRHTRGVNSTETPGGSGIPAGWYDDPSGAGLRWWDGEQWTEHVHSAESAAAAGAGGSAEDAGEGKPPRDLVKL